ncbi:MAG TPA: S8 family serine peptidase [Blastocatellia bacterium]
MVAKKVYGRVGLVLQPFGKFAKVLIVAFSLALPVFPVVPKRTGRAAQAPFGENPAQAQDQDLEPRQGYLDIAPGGMDVDFAWSLPGGNGENVKIIDIEFNWNLDHTDLKASASNLLVYVPGFDPDPADDINHGTAVLGELVANDNGIGVTGIANGSRIGLISPATSETEEDLPGALNKAASLLNPGDVILIELQALGPDYNVATGQGLVPVEFDSAVFAAIKRATSQGIVVIEPATNGSANLDAPAYQGAFNRNQRDSGAILVAAGQPPTNPSTDRAPIKESDYGSRVDLQGWGKAIVTCGFGDIRLGKGKNNWYTAKFGETSGASAMVAGAAAVLESIIKAQNQPPLAPIALRQLMASTGSAQTGNLARNVGPRPDLRAAITSFNAGSPSAAISALTQ